MKITYRTVVYQAKKALTLLVRLTSLIMTVKGQGVSSGGVKAHFSTYVLLELPLLWRVLGAKAHYRTFF